MQSPDLSRISDTLAEAQRTGAAVDQFGDDLTLDDAYTVQRTLLDRRRAQGARYLGPKLGFTSRAKMAQMGVDEVIVGWLLDDMRIPAGGVLSLDGLVHPRAEPEVAFRLGRAVDFDGPDDDIVHAVDAVAPALEIIDSRYRNFTFSLPDVVADNTSACRFVIGEWQPATATTEVANLDVVLSLDGRPVEHGSTSAILGSPWNALRELVPIARRYKFELHDGAVILAGAATAAASIAAAANVKVELQDLGSVTLDLEAGTSRAGGR
ncbi:2-keto-4-pentenoate hydratase [Nocardia sp. NPDC001965]